MWIHILMFAGTTPKTISINKVLGFDCAQPDKEFDSRH